MRARDRRTARGFLAGAIGTLVLTGFEVFEAGWVGGPTLYAAGPVARGLAARLVNRKLAGRTEALVGLLLRWTYGPCIGAVYARVRPRLPLSVPVAGVCLAGGILGFELLAMPALGATPPLGKWDRPQLWMLAAHTLSYGAGTAFAYDLLTRSSHREAATDGTVGGSRGAMPPPSTRGRSNHTPRGQAQSSEPKQRRPGQQATRLAERVPEGRP
jgi:hypothetical protein